MESGSGNVSIQVERSSAKCTQHSDDVRRPTHGYISPPLQSRNFSTQNLCSLFPGNHSLQKQEFVVVTCIHRPFRGNNRSLQVVGTSQLACHLALTAALPTLHNLAKSTHLMLTILHFCNLNLPCEIRPVIQVYFVLIKLRTRLGVQEPNLFKCVQISKKLCN